MKIAIPVTDERISPVADAAASWKVYESKPESEEVLDLSPYFTSSYPTVFKAHGVKIIICCGVSPLLLRLLAQQEIDVVWGVTGTPEEAVDALLKNELQPSKQRGGRRRRQHHGHCQRR